MEVVISCLGEPIVYLQIISKSPPLAVYKVSSSIQRIFSLGVCLKVCSGELFVSRHLEVRYCNDREYPQWPPCFGKIPDQEKGLRYGAFEDLIAHKVLTSTFGFADSYLQKTLNMPSQSLPVSPLMDLYWTGFLF